MKLGTAQQQQQQQQQQQHTRITNTSMTGKTKTE
jgi:hypothetical protein